MVDLTSKDVFGLVKQSITCSQNIKKKMICVLCDLFFQWSCAVTVHDEFGAQLLSPVYSDVFVPVEVTWCFQRHYNKKVSDFGQEKSAHKQFDNIIRKYIKACKTIAVLDKKKCHRGSTYCCTNDSMKAILMSNFSFNLVFMPLQPKNTIFNFLQPLFTILER